MRCAAFVIALGCAIVLLGAGRAAAAINPVTPDAAGAVALAEALRAPSTNVTSAGFETVSPTGTPNGVADAPFSFLPTGGPTFAILTSGNVSFADDPNDNVPDSSIETDDKSADLNGGNVDDGPHARGDTDFDVTVLRLGLDVPSGANCLTVDLAFYSEEFPEYVGDAYNDAFIAELDSSDWTTSGAFITAPHNFAFDQNGNVLSVNASGPTAMAPANAAGTTYDAATPLLSASTPVTPGAHTLYLSIFDQGDQILDSATLLDELRVGFVPDPAQNCKPGAQPRPVTPPPVPAPTPPTAGPPAPAPAPAPAPPPRERELRCLGRRPTIVAKPGRVTRGTRRADVIIGDSKAERIVSGAGNDRVCGRGGRDRISTGKGNDRVSAGPGRDRVNTGVGDDRVNPGSDPDRVKTGRGNDTAGLTGGARDRLDCGPGRDLAHADPPDRLRHCEQVGRGKRKH